MKSGTLAAFLVTAELLSLLRELNFYVLFGQVDGMDVLAVKQACKFAKEYVLKNGPMVSDWWS